MNPEEQGSRGGRSGVVAVLLNYAIARLAPSIAVPRLVAALGSRNEETATAAYVALVKLGPRIASLLLTEAHAGRQTAHVLHVLGDQCDQSVGPDVENFLQSADAAVAAAARESLQVLNGKPAERDR